MLDDIKYQENILEKFKCNERIFQIPESRADEIKYIISKCHIVVTLRTHASIAAYDSCVPTIVLGYSIKSKGLATDIFGTHEHFVVDINKKCFDKSLLESFEYIENNYDKVSGLLNLKIEKYVNECFFIKEAIVNI